MTVVVTQCKITASLRINHFPEERHLLPVLYLGSGGDKGTQECLHPAFPAPNCGIVRFCHNRAVFLEKAAETVVAGHQLGFLRRETTVRYVHSYKTN